MAQTNEAPPPYVGYGATEPEKPGYPPPEGAPPGSGYPPAGGAPPPGGYPATGYPPTGQQPPPYAQGNTTTVIAAQPVLQPVILRFGESPAALTCPQCQAQIVTSTHYVDGTAVWVVAGAMCLVGLWLGCCLIPFCINGLKDVHHTCPNCKRMLGAYRRM